MAEFFRCCFGLLTASGNLFALAFEYRLEETFFIEFAYKGQIKNLTDSRFFGERLALAELVQ